MRRPHRRLDVAAFAARFETSDRARRAAAMSSATWRKACDRGFTVRQADELACLTGVHPASLWPDWYEIDMADRDEARRSLNERRRAARARANTEERTWLTPI